MGPAAPVARQALYPERALEREAVLDRLLARLGFQFARIGGRRLPEQGEFVAQVRQQAERFCAAPLGPRVAEIRYRLRKEGFRAEPLAECLGLCSAALASEEGGPLAAYLPGAAALLLRGQIAELAIQRERALALALAAMALAVHGTPVHVLAASDARAARLAALMQGPLAALGLTVGCVTQQMPSRERRATYSAHVVCAALRVLATDYLRDRMQLGRKRGALRGTLERLSGDTPGAAQLMLRGLHCALVEEADGLMLDDALAPIVITAPTEPAGVDRLQCEQALELARALAAVQHFRIEPEGIALTESGAQALAQLAAPLGSRWETREQREVLCTAALEALHRLHRGSDYRVDQGRVIFPQAEEASAEPRDDAPLLRSMVEIKEGCQLSGAREVLARVSVPRFLRRYLHLAGACTDARGLEAGFWSSYGMKTTRAGSAAAPLQCVSRVFVSTASRRKVLLQTASDLVAGGGAVLVAVRSAAEAEALTAALEAIEPREAVAVTLYPAHRDAQRDADEEEGAQLDLNLVASG